jgi:ubiquinone/menaquinone biosynthesis C-methylase UbiE
MPTQFKLGPDSAESQPESNELNVIKELLNTEATAFLELGCGAAYQTRAVAENTNVESIVGVEIDAIQHDKNLLITDLPKVTFKSYGAESIQEEDQSFDAVIMLKSLHHVPVPRMHHAFQEIHRVLKTDGIAYISEPVFAGDFNDMMRLFHDEESVRLEAFNATVQAVECGLFTSQKQHFFRNKIRFASYQQYEAGVLGVTHTNHTLSDDVLAKVKQKFLSHESDEGFIFYQPNRVNLLRKS